MKKNLRIVVIALFSSTLCTFFSSCREVDLSTSQSLTITIGTQTVKNGETVNLTANLQGTYKGKSIIYNVVYYCDDMEIGTSTDATNNYLFTYVVKDLSLGYHTLSYKASYEGDNIKLQPSAVIKYINVIE